MTPLTRAPRLVWLHGSSVQYLSLCAGDPYRVDKRYLGTTTEELCGYHGNETIPSIPALPISYGDATPILRALGGPAAPEDFVGGIHGLRYTLGPSSAGKVQCASCKVA